MHINMVYEKIRIDGNIHPMIHVSTNKESHALDTNSEVDSIFCVFGSEDATVENIIAPLSSSHITPTR